MENSDRYLYSLSRDTFSCFSGVAGSIQVIYERAMALLTFVIKSAEPFYN